jgi:hypothetical protein
VRRLVDITARSSMETHGYARNTAGSSICSFDGLPDDPTSRAPSIVCRRRDIGFWRSQVIYFENCVS